MPESANVIGLVLRRGLATLVAVSVLALILGTPAGAAPVPLGAISEYAGASSAYAITSGPDGSLWFTEFGNGEIGRIDPLDPGAGVALYEVPSGSDSEPAGIVAGPDGSLWFTEYGTGMIGLINRVGRLQRPSRAPGPERVDRCGGSDGLGRSARRGR